MVSNGMKEEQFKIETRACVALDKSPKRVTDMANPATLLDTEVANRARTVFAGVRNRKIRRRCSSFLSMRGVFQHHILTIWRCMLFPSATALRWCNKTRIPSCTCGERWGGQLERMPIVFLRRCVPQRCTLRSKAQMLRSSRRKEGIANI